MPEVTGRHVQKPILHLLEDCGGLRCGNKVALVFVEEDNLSPNASLTWSACSRSSGGRGRAESEWQSGPPGARTIGRRLSGGSSPKTPGSGRY